MRQLITVLFTLVVFSSSAQFPYNPDANADGLITTSDLGDFLTIFGGEFTPEGLVPVENGGTSVTTYSELKDSLQLSLFKDTLLMINEMEEDFGWVDGGFRATGNVATGFETIATGSFSTAEGFSTNATGNFSHSQNRFTSATGICSHAEGEGGIASATAAHAEGFGGVASGVASHAEGYQTDATDFGAHAEGYQSTASGQYSHAQNRGNSASGISSHAEGQNTLASGVTAHAEGSLTQATGDRSHAAGLATRADQENQTVVGQYNLEQQEGTLFVVGNGSNDTVRADAFKVYLNGAAELAGTLTTGAVVVGDVDLLTEIENLQAENQSLQEQLNLLQQQVQDLIDNQ